MKNGVNVSRGGVLKKVLVTPDNSYCAHLELSVHVDLPPKCIHWHFNLLLHKFTSYPTSYTKSYFKFMFGFILSGLLTQTLP